MINKINVAESTKSQSLLNKNKKNNNPSFGCKKGLTLMGAVVGSMQYLERNPMMNVTVLDVGTAIGPRSIFDSLTNVFNGVETLIRESGGLIINCLAPGFIAIGCGKLLDKYVVKTGANMADCMADTETINRVSKLYKDNNGNTRAIYNSILSDISGLEGDKIIKYSEKVSNLGEYAKKLADAASVEDFNKVVDDLLLKTNVNEYIKLGEGKEFVKDTSVSSLLNNTRRFLKEYESTGAQEGIERFAQKAKNLVKGKSALALAVILPIAASMQYLNRCFTEKMSGIKGAPIYDDFKEAKENPELHERLKAHAKEGLLKQKIISVGAMASVVAASILLSAPGKFSLKTLGKMLEFKGKYPTMDQARLISGVTFMSRMAVSDDKNELRESRGRDIATFLSLYFLGDYAGKACATGIEAKTGMKLLNREVVSAKDANIFTKFKNWVLNTHIKSSSELTFADATKTVKAQKYRSLCQAVNLLSSFAILGLIIYQRKKTQKKRTEAKEQVLQQIEQEKLNNQQKEEMKAKTV